MSLIKSISGIRGTIGGKAGEGLSPIDVVRFSSAYAQWLIENNQDKKVVIGRDARISGPMVQSLVTSALQGMGIDVVDLGLSTTPTVEMAVPFHKAGGGIIITASHNPKEWNALKLLNHKGEFVSGQDGKRILEIAETEEYLFASVDELGGVSQDDQALTRHIDAILALPYVKPELIKSAGFSIVIDCVNSSGGISLPPLLEKLGVETVVELFCEPNGKFPHNPEPLPEHLTSLSSEVKKSKADLGITVDPDVDRLAFVCEDGEMFGEEYTLVAIADFMLKHKQGPTVSNLSSTKALRDVTEKAGQKYFASAVGEVNVVKCMKDNNAVIGGEGNGGIINPDLHYGRDALVGIAMFLTHLAESKMSISRLRASYPNYVIAKKKIALDANLDLDSVFSQVEEKYKKESINKTDGLKIEFGDEWVHLRKSNTEPIIRIYSESQTETTANNIADKLISDIVEIIKT